jgi:hypothetical protein
MLLSPRSMESDSVKTEIAALASLAIDVDQLQQLCLNLARGRQLAIQPRQASVTTGMSDLRFTVFTLWIRTQKHSFAAAASSGLAFDPPAPS